MDRRCGWAVMGCGGAETTSMSASARKMGKMTRGKVTEARNRKTGRGTKAFAAGLDWALCLGL